MVVTHTRTAAVDASRRPPPRRDYKALTVVAGIAVAMVLAMSVASRLMGHDTFGLMVRDPLAVARVGDDVTMPLVGVLSHLGVIVWGIPAVAALACARIRLAQGDTPYALFLLLSGLLSAGLGVDDLFQVHEYFIPKYLGVGERYVMASWALLAVLWFLAFRQRIMRAPELPVLMLGAVFLALSIIGDAFEGVAVVDAAIELVGGPAVFEEGFKLAGVVCWAFFHWRVSVTALARSERRARD